MHRGKASSLLLAVLLPVLCASHAGALTLGLGRVADLTTTIPGGTGSFTEFSSFPVISGRNVAFLGAGSSGQAGNYLFNGAGLGRVADTSTAIPSGTGNFTEFPSPPVISGDKVAFLGFGASGQRGIYLFNGATLSRVADKSTLIPGGAGTFTSFSSPVISGGNVAFQGSGSGGQQGIYLFDGALIVVADTSTAIPGGTGNFTLVSPPVISDGNVAFLGVGGSGQAGIYLFDGTTLSRMADKSTTIPSGTGTFTSFSSLVISGGNVAFQGAGTGGQLGVYLFDGATLTRVADTNTAIPGGTGNFLFVNPPAISGGNVTFQGAGSVGQLGIYLFNGTALSRVADKSTAIPSGMGNFTEFPLPPVISGGNVAFLGFGAFEQRGIYLFNGTSLSRVADKNTAIPAGTGNFTDLSNPAISGSHVAFLGLGPSVLGLGGSSQEGIYVTSPSSRLWVGLRNSDDFGTAFDLRVEVYKNGVLVTSGLRRCVTGLVRNPAGAREIDVAFDPFDPVPLGSGDVLSLKVLTRIGTKPGDSRCTAIGATHNNATGLRLYYDSANRASRFGPTVNGSSADMFLHSDGGVCTTAQSAGVTTRFLNSTAPTGTQPKCKDSGGVKFGGGNAWSVIGTWSTAPLP